MKKIEQYIKEEMKDCPFTQEQEDKLLIGLTNFLDDLEQKQLNIHSVVVPKGTLPKCQHDWIKSVTYKNAKCCRKCGKIL